MADITCQQLVGLVTSYLEGDLDPDTRQRFEEHLARCEGCATYLAQFEQTIAVLGQLPVDALSEEATTRLLGAFHDWSTRP